MRDLRRPRVLIVDDEPNMRFMLKRILEGEGYEVVEARNGAVALAQMLKLRPGLSSPT